MSQARIVVGGATVALDGKRWTIDKEPVHEVTLDRWIAAAQAAALERIARAMEERKPESAR